MKKNLAYLMMLVMAMLSLSLTSCHDAEEGEDAKTTSVRNKLNGGWQLSGVKVNGAYEWGTTFHMELNLYAEGRRFEAHRFDYMTYTREDGTTSWKINEATEIYKTGTFTIEDNNTSIVATTSDGQKFFKLKFTELTSTITGTITFFDTNKTYDVQFGRSTRFKMPS